MVSGKSSIKVGDRVKHTKFGEGDVLDIYPIGEDTCLIISFEKLGQKKIIQRFAELELVPEEKEEQEGEEAES